MNSICMDILKQTKSQTVCFVGLPCQVAAVKKYADIHQIDENRLFFVDLVCHGVPSHEYLKDHIENTVHANNTEAVTFRDSDYMTSKFVFSVKHDGGKKYSKFVESDDNYQIGYHNATIYRSNCYQCKYAKAERTGDITFSDFSGFGKIAPFEGDVQNEKYQGISCLLVSTQRGQEWVDEMMDNDLLKCFERHLDEALQYEQQLKGPSVKSEYRSEFEQLYPKQGFTKACNKVFKKEKMLRPVKHTIKKCAKFVLRRK